MTEAAISVQMKNSTAWLVFIVHRVSADVVTTDNAPLDASRGIVSIYGTLRPGISGARRFANRLVFESNPSHDANGQA